MGLSGAILGLIAAFSLVFPRQPIYLFFILRIEGRWLLPLTIGMDTLLFLTQPGSFAYATHMGGLLMGYLLVTGYWRPGPTLDRIRLARLKSNGATSESYGIRTRGRRCIKEKLMAFQLVHTTLIVTVLLSLMACGGDASEGDEALQNGSPGPAVVANQWAGMERFPTRAFP